MYFFHRSMEDLCTQESFFPLFTSCAFCCAERLPRPHKPVETRYAKGLQTIHPATRVQLEMDTTVLFPTVQAVQRTPAQPMHAASILFQTSASVSGDSPVLAPALQILPVLRVSAFRMASVVVMAPSIFSQAPVGKP